MRTRKTTVLAVSSGGGHWVQLLRLRPAFEGSDVTFATVREGYRADVEGSGEFTVIADCNRSRKLKVLQCIVSVFFLLMRVRPDVVVSTGAAPGYFALRLGRWFGARTIWVDSVANAEELSMSGQMAGKYADLWLTQWRHLAKEKGPVFRGERPVILVTVGTDGPFDRLITTVDTWVGQNGRDDVIAQIGRTTLKPKHLRAYEFLDPPQFREYFAAAELIIAHAGMGTILSALRYEKPLLVMPRRAALGEQRNEHQLATARRLQEMGKVTVAIDEADLLVRLGHLQTLTAATGRISPFASPSLTDAIRTFINASNSSGR